MFLLEWPGGSWEATLRISLSVLAIYLGAIWIALVFWTYRDIRQRSRDPIVQTVAVLLVLTFFLPGHWIYLILRPRYTLTELYERSLEEEALLQDLEDQKACPTCKRRVQEDFLICPSCRTHLKEPCRSCQKPLSYAWVACPYCGLEKAPREHLAPRPARPAATRAAAGKAATTSAPAQKRRRTEPEPSREPEKTPQRQPSRDPFGQSSRQRPLSEDSSVIDATAE